VNQYDAEAGAKMSLQRSGGMVDDLLAHGASVLGALGEQKERLKGAQHKMLDLLNSIGVSASLLRVIDRRQRMDAMLVYGGMLFTVVLLLIIWLFSGKKK
jgi:Golgi SNAP receptor complex protein 2